MADSCFNFDSSTDCDVLDEKFINGETSFDYKEKRNDPLEYDVAVIIPTYNEEQYIEKCIKSLRCQTFLFSKMDVVIVDGLSTDKTQDIVKKMSRKWSNIRLINNPGKIQAIAFNLGVAQSTAPFILRLDAHVTYDVHYIEFCVNHLKSKKDLGNVGGICHMASPCIGLIPEASAILNSSRFGIGGATFRIGGEPGYVDTVPFGAFTRRVLDKVGGFREDLVRGEDNELNSRLKRNGFKIYFDPNIISTYYPRDTISGCVKQMYSNGYSIGRLLHIDKDSISIRHLVPVSFVLSLIICIIGSYVCLLFLWLLLAEFAFYIVANIFATIVSCRKNGFRFIFVLPWLYFIIHIAYGWGTIMGYFVNK